MSAQGERKKRTDQLSKVKGVPPPFSNPLSTRTLVLFFVIDLQFGLLAPFDWAKDAALPTALQTDKPLVSQPICVVISEWLMCSPIGLLGWPRS